MSINPKLVTEQEFDNITDDEVDALARYLNLLALAKCAGAGKVTVTVEGENTLSEEVTYQEGGRVVTVTSESAEMQFPPRPIRRRAAKVYPPGVIPEDLKCVPACVETIRKYGGEGMVSILVKGARVDAVAVEYGHHSVRPFFVLQE